LATGDTVTVLISKTGIAMSALSGILSLFALALGTLVSITGSLAFVSDRDGEDEIYILDIDRGFLYRVTDNLFRDRSPSWSPDGRHIAFQSDRDGNEEIYVMNANGSHVARLTENTVDDLQPTWSPDGSRIAFISARHGGTELYVMNTDGSSVHQLTDNFAWDGNPGWLHDGRIGFDSTRARSSEIFVMDLNGTDVQQITENPASDVEAAWSHTTHAVFVSNRDGQRELYTADADCIGCEPQRLTSNNLEEYYPAWSPDGRWIAFFTTQQANTDIYLVSTDGSILRRVTDHSASDRFPAWWPR
jgi:Tol biopolymer transport system component